MYRYGETHRQLSCSLVTGYQQTDVQHIIFWWCSSEARSGKRLPIYAKQRLLWPANRKRTQLLCLAHRHKRLRAHQGDSIKLSSRRSPAGREARRGDRRLRGRHAASTRKCVKGCKQNQHTVPAYIHYLAFMSLHKGLLDAAEHQWCASTLAIH